MWRSYLYAMFGVLSLNLSLLIIVIALVSVLSTYLSLQNGNWAWWWRSFGIGCSTGYYLIIYTLFFFAPTEMSNLFWSDLVMLLYTLLFGSMFATMCGAISLCASYAFLTIIYSTIKSA